MEARPITTAGRRHIVSAQPEERGDIRQLIDDFSTRLVLIIGAASGDVDQASSTPRQR
jgi:hypothetical protein